MYSIRRWLYKPRRDDTSILAQFFYADENLNYVATELDSFDGRKEPERCTHLVNQLRQCQDKVLNICNQIMDDVIPDQRANRDFRVKFPDDVLQENLAGQLWFGAECLAAGSSIMNREVESASMRPLAKAVTKTLDNVRNLLKEQCLRNPVLVTDKIREALRVFDRFFAEFELSYVSAMVPVKTMREYDMQQEVIVLFSETLYRALQVGLMTQEMVDDYDPALMFTIPRLAIICGLLVYPDGPLNVNLESDDMSEMFKPFRNLLRKIRDVLWSLNKMELNMLEKALCNVEEPGKFQTSDTSVHPLPNVDDYVQKVCADYPSCKQFISTYYNFDLTHVPLDEEQEEEEEDESVWMHDCNSGEELLAFQESLSNTLTKVIERSGTRDSGLHSDSCSNASESSHNLQCMVVSEEEKCVEKEVTSSGHSAAVQDMADQTVTRVVEEIIEETVESLDGPRIETTSRSHVVDKNGAIPKRCNATAACDSSPSRKVQRRHLHRVFHSCPSSPYNREQNSSDLRHVYSDTWVYSSSGSSCRSASSSEWDSDCCSSDTSSYNSECQDDEEIALAIQAAEIATRSGALGRFRNTEDLVHRLFVCIAGVADQLQTNHASDLRNILKFVFQMNCTEPITPPSPPEKRSQLISNMILEEEHEEVPSEERISVESAEEANENSCHSPIRNSEEPPQWIPDDVAPECMSCRATFNVVRRRHHCRNCGKVFCSKCSSNSVPLPHYGHSKPVRVCDNCFLFQVASFLINDEA